MINPHKLIDSLQKELNNNSKVLAFVLVGSQAREDVYRATEYSDMEAYIIVKDEDFEAVENQLPNLVKKFGDTLFTFRHSIGFIAVFEDLFRLELPVIKESGLKGLFVRPKAQVVKVLIDRTNGKLQRILDSRPETIDFAGEFKDKIVNFWHWQILGSLYFKKGEIYNTRAVMGIHASVLIWMFELINDPEILLLETNKRIEKFLTVEQLGVLKELTPKYTKEEVGHALRKSMEIFPTIFKQITEKYGYEYDENLELKVKPKVLELLST